MAGIFGGASGAKTTKPPVYTCLQLQTSAQGLPIPIIWGTNRISGNCIDYFNFVAKPAGKGKGGKSNGDTYTASVILALCEGSATGDEITLGRMWNGTSETTLEGFGGGLFPGTASQAPWSTAVAKGHTDAYAYTCYYANGQISLGSSASLPNLNFEIISTFHNQNVPASASYDANFGDIIPDFLCNSRYGVNFNPAYLSGFNDGGSLTSSNTSLLVYNYAAGIYVSPLLKDPEQVSSILQRWANVANCWIFWSGTALKCVCLGDSTLTATGPHGEDVQFIPNVTPVYDLGIDDFVVAEKNSNKADPPVTVNRKDPADGYNQVQLNCSLRDTEGGGPNTASYQDTPYRWQDSASIDHVGVQAPNVISSTEICNSATAAVVVTLIGQRAQYIRNEYAFVLSAYFVLLEPGDIVTLTEPNIGLNKLPARIKSVDEDNKGNLSFVAEEFPYGVGTAATIQENEPWAGSEPFNTQTPPGPVNTPAFVQPDTSLTGGVPQVWVALSGGPSWGGAGVFVSYDGDNYTQIGECDTGSLQGTLTAALPLVTGLDTASTLAIDLTESEGVIPATATEADAQAYRTLCLIDDELLAYGSVTPTGDYTANLTYLERGLYGTTAAAHASGAAFSRIDPTAVFSYTLPAGAIGRTLYFLFPSANLFGNAAQMLSDCTEYTFTPGGEAPTGLTCQFPYQYAAEDVGLTCIFAVAEPYGDVVSYALRFSTEPASVAERAYVTYSGVQPGGGGFELSQTVQTGGYISVAALYGNPEFPVQSADWSADLVVPVPTLTSLTPVFDYTNAGAPYQGAALVWPQASGTLPSSYLIVVNGSVADPATGAAATAPGGDSQGVTLSAVQAPLVFTGNLNLSIGVNVPLPSANVIYGTANAGYALGAILNAIYGASSSPQNLTQATATGSVSLGGTVSSLAATSPATGEMVVKWNAPTDAVALANYIVLYSEGTAYDDEGYAVYEAPTSTSCTVTGLSSGATLNVWVLAYNKFGTSTTLTHDPTHGYLFPDSGPTTTVTIS